MSEMSEKSFCYSFEEIFLQFRGKFFYNSEENFFVNLKKIFL